MVYEKYIKRGNRTYGPYYYYSERIGNKIVSRYLPHIAHDNFFKGKNIYLMLLFLGLFLAIAGFFLYLNSSATGRMTFDVDSSYNDGEQIKGNLKFNLVAGELVPKDSIVSVSLGEQKKEISLSTLTDSDYISGSFYVENSQIAGEGEGYGIMGERTNNPLLNILGLFTVLIMGLSSVILLFNLFIR